MDDDEGLVQIASLVIVVIAGFRFYRSLLQRAPLRRREPGWAAWLLAGLPLLLLALLRLALVRGAAREVRDDGRYIMLFVSLGAAWLVGLSRISRWLGIDFREDVVERGNVAAAIALGGAWIGGASVYTFANFGEGPTIWTTIGPALLGTLTAAALWAAHQTFSGATDAIGIDRDIASGIRFAGMTIGSGLVLGRAVAGDYESAEGTLADFVVQGWPALLLVALAAFTQLRLRPGKARPRSPLATHGLVPALFYVSLGVVDLAWLGAWTSAGAKP